MHNSNYSTTNSEYEKGLHASGPQQTGGQQAGNVPRRENGVSEGPPPYGWNLGSIQPPTQPTQNQNCSPRVSSTNIGESTTIHTGHEAQPRNFENPRHDHNTKKFQLQRDSVPGVVGIQGFDNSCYMDASLVSLFLYDKSFLGFLKKGSQATKFDPYQRLSEILEKQISLHLNDEKHLEARYGVMREFRQEMSRYDPSYFQDQKDPEEFMSSLFGNILGSLPFYHIEGEEDGGFVFQTYGVPNECNADRSTSVQRLVDSTFKDSDIRLASVPSPGFIIKLPVTNGKHMFSKVFVNLNLSLEHVLDKAVIQSGKRPEMGLSAVICLKANHFTAFVRMDPKERNLSSPWVYLDSLAHSEHTLISNLCELLEKEGKKYDDQDSLLELLMRNAYMCVYLPS